MKKLIVTNCILAIAVIFTYCAKPDLQEQMNSVDTNDVAYSRGTCTLTNIPPYNTATLTFCGTNTNATGCLNCKNTLSQGVEVQAAAAVNLTLQTPIIFSVTADKQTAVNFTAGGTSPGIVQIPVGGCKVFSIDNNCNITVLN